MWSFAAFDIDYDIGMLVVYDVTYLHQFTCIYCTIVLQKLDETLPAQLLANWLLI